MKKQNNKETENGSGGITYAMCIMLIFVVVIFYTFTIFHANTYVLAEILENGLHVIESSVLATPEDEGAADFNKDLHRLKIIPKSTTDLSGLNYETEKQQVNEIGNKIQDMFITEFSLTNYKHPSKGMLLNMCGNDTDTEIAIADNVVIYEPIYKKKVEVTENPDTIVLPGDNYVPNKWNFLINYEIIAWVKYELHFVDNIYQNTYHKTVYNQKDLSVMKNGEMTRLEGAMIEMTARVIFKGVNNIFATGGQSLFTNNPTKARYDVCITKYMDIVPAEKDSRKS